LVFHILPLILLFGDILAVRGQAEIIMPCDTGWKNNPDDVLMANSLYGAVQNGITKADVTLDFSIDDLTQFTCDPAPER
jgi:hypothetical protein